MKRVLSFFLMLLLLTNYVFASDNKESDDDIQKRFSEWILNFKKTANKDYGIDNKILNEAFKNVEYKKKVINLDRNQPEFKKVFWNYYDDAIHPLRVKRGKEKIVKYKTLLNRVYKKYGVPPNIIVAFWGMESDYGRYMGNSNVIEVLTTLSFDHRRSKFFTNELIQALKILQSGKINLKDMKGSWAGAFGNFQFMPSTYVAYAVDGDGDGKIDLRNSLPDAFYSAGNYLSKMGWDSKHRWGRPVKFDKNNKKIWNQVNSKDWKNLSYFSSLGITRMNGNKLPNAKIKAKLIAPMGKDGPTFLIYKNFKLIMNWNNSINYALSVGLLSDALTDNQIGKIERKK